MAWYLAHQRYGSSGLTVIVFVFVFVSWCCSCNTVGELVRGYDFRDVLTRLAGPV